MDAVEAGSGVAFGSLISPVPDSEEISTHLDNFFTTFPEICWMIVAQ